MTDATPRAYPVGKLSKLDPDPMLREFRTREPISRVQLPYGEPAWLVTRYEDVKVVVSDSRFSRAAGATHDQPRTRPRLGSPGSLMSTDPPEHTRLRRLVASAFTPRRIEQLRPRVQEITDDLIDAMVDGGSPADLVESVALRLPVKVICELLGVPFEDRAEFRVWSNIFFSTTRFTIQQVEEYAVKLRQYMANLIAKRREHTSDDLLGALIAARDEHDRLSEQELLSLAESLLVGGFETVAAEIPNFVYTLLTHPEQLALLREDVSRIPHAVEELMRFIPLTMGPSTPRYALEDVELGGVTIRAGDAVVPSLVSANYDESAYSQPDRLDLLRTEAPHLGFGHGMHFCVGASLARLELQVMLSTLLRRLPGLSLASGENNIEWKSGMITRGPKRLMVSWEVQ
jgi:cytochrome P450